MTMNYRIVDGEETGKDIYWNRDGNYYLEVHNDNTEEAFNIVCTGTKDAVRYGLSMNAEEEAPILLENSGIIYDFYVEAPITKKLTGNFTKGIYGLLVSEIPLIKRVTDGTVTYGTGKLTIAISTDFNANVTFDPNTGTGGPGTKVYAFTATYEVTRNYCLIPYDTPTLDGYEFAGWSATQYPVGEGTAEYEVGSSYYFPSSVIEGTDTTIYAVWKQKQNYTSKLIYDLNGGTDPSVIFVTNSDTQLSLNAPADRNVVLPDSYPTWTSSAGSCRGWSYTKYETGLGTPDFAAGDTIAVPYQAGDEETVTGTTLYAVWSLEQTWHCNILYEGNGGTPTETEDRYETTASVKPGDTHAEIKSDYPTRGSEEECIGWNSDSTATTAEYKGGDIVNLEFKKESVTEPNMTLYAIYQTKVVWKSILKFDSNGGTGTFDDLVDSKRQVEQPTAYDFTIPDYTPIPPLHNNFKGWANSASATTPDYVTGDTCSVDYETGTEVGKTLYAVYQPLTSYSAYVIYSDCKGNENTKTYTVYSETAPATIDITLSPEDCPSIGSKYIFMGWSGVQHTIGEGDVDFKVGDTIQPAPGVTVRLYAVYRLYYPRVKVKVGRIWKNAKQVLEKKNGTWIDGTTSMYVKHDYAWHFVDVTKEIEKRQYTITFSVTPSDATIKYKFKDGVEHTLVGTTLTVDAGTFIEYTFEKEGYLTYTNSLTVDKNKTIEYTMIKQYTITFDITPSDTVIKYKLNSGEEQTLSGTTLTVRDGDILDYEFSKTGYVTYNNSLTVSKDETIEYTMVKQQHTITFVVTPSDATIKYKVNGGEEQTLVGTTLTTDYGDSVSYEFSKTGYTTYTNSLTVSKDETITYTMEEEPYVTVYDSTGVSHKDIEVVDDGSYDFNTAWTYNSGVVGDLNFKKLESITTYGFLASSFADCPKITSVSFPNLTTVGSAGLINAFQQCTGITSISFPSLTSIGIGGLRNAFTNCSITGSVSFPSLTTVEGGGLNIAFLGCTEITEVHFKSSLSGNEECTVSNMCCSGTVYFDLP